MTTSTLHQVGAFGETSRVNPKAQPHILKRASDGFQRYFEYRKAVAEMSACSDRTLRDLGIFRGDIRRLACEATYGGK